MRGRTVSSCAAARCATAAFPATRCATAARPATPRPATAAGIARWLALAAASAAWCGAAAPAAARCCPPRFHAEHRWRGTSIGASVTADGLGNVHVCHAGPDGTFRMRTSRDDGLTFEDEDPAPFGGAMAAACAATREGGLLVASLRDAAVWTRWSEDGGRTFGEPVRAFDVVDVGRFGGFRPSIELRVRGDGLTALAATTLEEEFPSVILGVKTAASPSFGATWGPALHRRQLADDVDAGQTLALSEGVVITTWTQGDAAWVQRSPDAGGSWDPRVRVDDFEDVRSTYATATSGGFFQVFFDTLDGRRLVTVSEDGAATWPGPPSEVGTAGEGRVLGMPEWVAVVGTPEEPVPVGVEANGSREHALPGTWLAPPERFSTGGEGQHHYRLAGFADGTLLAVHDDYRENTAELCPPGPTGGFSCESIYLARSCDAGRGWLPEELRLDDDAPPHGTHSEDAEIAGSPRGFAHVVWSDPPLDDDLTLHYRSLLVPPAPRPELVVDVDPEAGCDGRWIVVRALRDPDVPCLDALHRWLLDGAAIPDETSDTLRLPADLPPGLHEVAVRLECDGAGCGGESRPLPVDVPIPGAAPPPTVEELAPRPCAPTPFLLSVPDDVLATCAEPEIRWERDGEPVEDATSSELDVSQENTPPGEHAFAYRLACGSPLACLTSGAVLVEIAEDGTEPPAPVGDALRAFDHGSPEDDAVRGDFEWRLDEGTPRGPDEHYHWLRGEHPSRLSLVSELEPLVADGVADLTPRADTVPHAWFYRVVAADACGRESTR